MSTNKNKYVFKKSFFFTILGFNQSHSIPLGDIEGTVQAIPGSYKSDKTINFTGIDKIHLKSDCINDSIANGCREPNLYNFALVKLLGHEIFKEPRVKVLKKINKSVHSHITVYMRMITTNQQILIANPYLSLVNYFRLSK